MARILVIEDNEANLDLMTYLLSAFGHFVLSATDGVNGLSMALAEWPDLVICDVHLPGLDGYAIAHHLKAEPLYRGIPLLAVTALAMVGDRDQILVAGFDGYLAKPILPESFVPQIEAFLPSEKRIHALPASPPAEPVPLVTPPERKGITILVVDDGPVNLELMRSVLEPFGYTVSTAGNVSSALELARTYLPNLIISDMHMQDQTGLDLLQQCKADPLLCKIPFMIHSATIQSEQDRLEALRLGAAAVMLRPAEPMQLLAEIAACLEL